MKCFTQESHGPTAVWIFHRFKMAAVITKNTYKLYIFKSYLFLLW